MFETNTIKFTETFCEMMLLLISLLMQECMRDDHSVETKDALITWIYFFVSLLVGLNFVMVLWTAVKNYLQKRRNKKIEKMRQEKQKQDQKAREKLIKKALMNNEARAKEIKRKRIERRNAKKAKKDQKR